MSGWTQFVLDAVLIGVGATAVMDLWGLLLLRLFAVPSLDFAMVGRWLGHLPRGRFRYAAIGQSAAVAGERALGWSAHYVTGVVFAAMLLAVAGDDWARAPTVLPALLFGVLSVVAPFLITQPGMGAGIAASKTPAPQKARLRSLVTHAVFGIGMYLAACLLVAINGV